MSQMKLFVEDIADVDINSLKKKEDVMMSSRIESMHDACV